MLRDDGKLRVLLCHSDVSFWNTSNNSFQLGAIGFPKCGWTVVKNPPNKGNPMKSQFTSKLLVSMVTLLGTLAAGGAAGIESGVAGATTTTVVSSLTQPQALAIDPTTGTIFVIENSEVDSSQNVVEMAPNGSGGFTVASVIANSGEDAYATLAVDASGNVFVGDTTTGTVHEIPSNGDGTFGASTQVLSGFTSQNGLAVDASGTIYVTQNSMPFLQKFPANVPNDPSQGYGAGIELGTFGGLGFSSSPTYVAVDGTGNLFLICGNEVLEITPAGQQRRIASGGPFESVAVDTSNNVFVGQQYGGEVDEVSPNGAGGYDGAVPVFLDSNNTSEPAVAVDASGNFFVLDVVGGNVLQVSPSTPDIPVLSGSPADGAATLTVGGYASFPNATKFSMTDGQGHACVATELFNGWYSCKVDGLTNGTDYTFTATATSSLGTSDPSTSVTVTPEPDPPRAPSGGSALVITNGTVKVSWVAATQVGDHAISYTVTDDHGQTCTTVTLSCTMTGLSSDTPYTFHVVATNVGGPSSALDVGPVVVPSQSVIHMEGQAATGYIFSAVDAAGNIYLTNGEAGTINKFTPTGSGGYAASPVATGIRGTSGIAVDMAGNVFTSEVTSHGSIGSNVVEFTPNGLGGYAESTVATGLASALLGLAVDATGDVFVTSPTEGIAAEFTPNGSGGYTESIVATGLKVPIGVAVDAAGDVFISELYGGSEGFGGLDRFTPNGSGGYTKSTVGSFYVPAGLAIDPAGNLFVTGAFSGIVAEFTPNGSDGYTESMVSTGLPGFLLSIAIDTSGVLYVPAKDEVWKIGFRMASGLLPASTRGQSYSEQLFTTGRTSGGKLAWKTNSIVGVNAPLPTGMKLSKSGVLSGKPSRKLLPGNYSVDVQVSQTVVTRVKKKTTTTVLTVRARMPIIVN